MMFQDKHNSWLFVSGCPVFTIVMKEIKLATITLLSNHNKIKNHEYIYDLDYGLDIKKTR